MEDRLRPPDLPSPWARDIAGVGLLMVLAAVLMPAWTADENRYLTDVTGQIFSCYLLPAMGFMLALRQGAVDLSVWMSASAGGLVAAAMIRAGAPPAQAFLVAAGAGLAIGLVNGLLVAWGRLPSPLVTIITAVLAMWVAGRLTGGRPVAIPERALAGWPFGAGVSVLAGRVLLVAGAYALMMSAMLGSCRSQRPGAVLPRGLSLAGALCVSGVLSALGGAAWLLDQNAAPSPTRPVEDLRVAAAAILAGGAFFAGRWRGLLAGLCLPVAMLLVTIWRQRVWSAQAMGYDLQVLLLIGMTLTVQLALARALDAARPRAILSRLSAALASGGLLVAAYASGGMSAASQRNLVMAGTGACAAGAALLALVKALDWRRQAPVQSAGAEEDAGPDGGAADEPGAEDAAAG